MAKMERWIRRAFLPRETKCTGIVITMGLEKRFETRS
jgi:hypothetical protein